MPLVLSEQEKARCLSHLFAEYHRYTLHSPVYGEQVIYIRYPHPDDLTEAALTQDEVMDYFRFDDFYDRESIVTFIKKHRVDCPESEALEEQDDDPVYYWTKDHEEKMKQCEDSIEKIKERYYNNFDNPKKREQLKNDLENTNRIYNEMSARKHSFDFLTKESVASKMYARALYSRTVYDAGMNRIRDIHPLILDNIAKAVHEREMAMYAMIREISHTNPWVSHYSVFKRDPFGKRHMNGLMMSLVSYTRWYEAMPSHEGYPYRKDGEEQIVDDDIAIDGWWIITRRKLEEERLKNKTKLADAGKFNEENFVMAATPEEAKAVYERNSRVGRGIIANRLKQIEKVGTVENHKLNDNAFDLGLEINRMTGVATQAKQQGKAIRITGR